MKAYSQDFRERVLRAVDQGHPRTEIVQLVGISRASIKRYLKQRREEGHVRPKAIPGRPPSIRARVEADILPQLQAVLATWVIYSKNWKGVLPSKDPTNICLMCLQMDT